ncbi:hypothetical protein EON65_17580 [archaeon]|nr:MAG: hypothetical protein EON65_17580 [archaeon]
MHQRMSKSVLILLLVCIFHVYAQRWYYTGKFENEQVERHLFLGDILHYDRLFNSQTVGQTFLYSGGLVIKAAQYSSDEIVLGDSDNAFIRSVCDQHSMPGSSIQDIHIQSRMLYNIIISHNYSPKINESSGSVYHALLEAEIGLFNGKSFLEKKMLEVSSGNLTAIIVKGTYLSNSIEVEVDMSGKPLELAMYVVEHKIVYTSDFFGRVALVMHTWNHVSPPSPPISSKPNLASSTDQAGQGRKVRLMSYNLWHNNPPDWVYHDRKARWQRYAQRLQHFADIIVEHDPDIVMLQEVRMDSSFFNAQANLTYWTKADQTKADAGSQVEHLLHHLEASREALQLPAVDYHVVFQPAMLMFDRAKMVFRNEEGVMILSKLPLFDIQTVFLPRDIGNPSDDHQRVLLVAKAKVGDNVVEVATSHFR